MSKHISPVGPHALWYEEALAHEQREGDVEHTLFVQLTKFELLTIQFGLFWLGRIYGAGAIRRLVDKLHDVIVEQEFCQCPKCRAKREEEE